jgi:hypothetical protein
MINMPIGQHDVQASREIAQVLDWLAHAPKSIEDRMVRQLMKEFEVDLYDTLDQRSSAWAAVVEEDLAGK